jgi:ribosomally synthesized peptide (two-chain TOMM family)
MSMNKLMEFRTTFLRAIAEAWFDSSFKTALLGKDSITALEAKFPPYKWGWPGTCTLQILESKPLDRQIPDGQSQFQWIDDAWVYSPDLKDGLTLYLPLDGNKIPEKQRARALGDYYRQYASLFSDDWGIAPSPPSSLVTEPQTMEKPHPLATPVIGPNSAAPIGGFVPSDEEFAAFKVALLGAMAKAWQDDSFKAMLTIDAAAALSAIRSYKLPWNMKIKIAEDKEAQWCQPRDPLADPRSFWIQRIPNVLRLYFPDKPEDVRAEPMALAMYNATGAEFPFTCTC